MPCRQSRRVQSEIAVKDEFCKNVTREDRLAAHRLPLQLLGIVPSNSGGFGMSDTAARVFGRHGIQPRQVRFGPYAIAPATPIAFSRQ